MKKIVVILLCLSLIGCSNQKEDDNVSIMCPPGAPAYVFYNHIDDLQIGDPSAIKTQVLLDDGPDYAVLPSNVAVSLLNGGINYKLVAGITFGNFFICSTGKDDNDEMEVGDNIVLFSEGSVSDLVFHLIYGNEYDDSIIYVSDVNAALREVVNENSNAEYVLIAQPALTIALSKNQNAKEYANLQKQYYAKMGNDMFQAVLLVSNNVEKKDVDLFLKQIKKEINDLIDNPNLLANSIEEDGLSDEEAQAYFGNVDAGLLAINNENEIGIGFKYAYDNKVGLDAFLKLFNIGETSEEIYFK